MRDVTQPSPQMQRDGSGESYDLFLLAHPDDELFVRPLLAPAGVARTVVGYLTGGHGPRLADAATRRREATNSLAAAGATEGQWWGLEQNVEAGALHRRFADMLAATSAFIAQRGRPRRIITHAWEGGHPDHDAAHLLSLSLANRAGVTAASLAASYYRAPEKGLQPFRVMAPLKANGSPQRIPLSLAAGMAMLASARHYPTQAIPLLGLSPGMAATAIVRRSLFVQSLSDSSAPRRPMSGSLLYERRNGLRFEDFMASLAPSLEPWLLDRRPGETR